jgi:membrane protease YdiL (CAAX protease family)
VILLSWLDLARVLVVGVLLGVFVGRFVARRPFYFERLRPRYWRAVMRRMKWKDWAKLITIAIAVAVVSIFISNEIGALLQRAEIPIYSPQEFPFTAIPKEYPAIQKAYPWLLLVLVNVLPIFEEWIFRGIFIDEILRWRHSKLLAVALSTIIFAVFHLSNPGTYPAYVLPLIPGGLLLGVCYLYTGLGGAIIAHDLYNTYLVIIGFFT